MMPLRVLVISESTGPPLGADISVSNYAPEDISRISSLGNFSAAVLAGDDPATLMALRAKEEWIASPIFALDPALAEHPLSDGPLPQDFKAFLEVVEDRSRKISSDLEYTVDTAILTYLWKIETRRLAASLQLRHSHLYEYVQLTAFGVTNAPKWLAEAEDRGWIARDSVIDRTRNCGDCGGAHLNYVDRCPFCEALDISAEQAIHCFTCGLVEEEGSFNRGQRMVCPKCQTALKHIGTDYDRPIERYRCRDCGERFNDGKVKATCLECGSINAQSDLLTRTYRSYCIGPAGESLLRLGRSPDAAVQPFGEAVGRQQFLWTLNWLNEIAHGPGRSASVVKIVCRGLPFEHDEGQRTVLALRSQIGALLSPTDVLLHYDPETMLLLLPSDGLDRLQGLVKDLEGISASKLSGEFVLEIDSVLLPLPEIATNAMQWLAQFAEERKCV